MQDQGIDRLDARREQNHCLRATLTSQRERERRALSMPEQAHPPRVDARVIARDL